MIMLDSDTCIRLIRHHAKTGKRLLEHSDSVIGISSIVFYEVEIGVHLNRIPKSIQSETRKFLSDVQVFDFSAKAATIAAEIEGQRVRNGLSAGIKDAFIAAHAIALNAVLVTANTKHFEGTPGLQLADWSK